jgi:hypothetical protein
MIVLVQSYTEPLANVTLTQGPKRAHLSMIHPASFGRFHGRFVQFRRGIS